jgi:hypothetical protein
MDGTEGGGIFPIESWAESDNVYDEGEGEDYSAADQVLFHITMFGKRAEGLNRFPHQAIRFCLTWGRTKKGTQAIESPLLTPKVKPLA